MQPVEWMLREKFRVQGSEVLLMKIQTVLNRVNRRVVEFYKALENQEAPSTQATQEFPSSKSPQKPFENRGVVEFHEAFGKQEEAPSTQATQELPSLKRPQKPFEKLPEDFHPKFIITCYHCRRLGHPASACTMNPLLLSYRTWVAKNHYLEYRQNVRHVAIEIYSHSSNLTTW